MKRLLFLFFLFPFLSPGQPFSGADPENDRTLKIITYNIWNGFEWGKDAQRHQRFIEWVKEQAPDVLALQELCGYTPEKLKEDAAAWGHAYSVLLKTDGYPVGITANQPIRLKEKLLEGLWHGLLHVETYGIDFFVVHLSPADYAFRVREAAAITGRVKAAGGDNFIVLGDFNAVSPMDADLYLSKTSLLERYRKSDRENEKYDNLRDGEWDYAVLSTFLALPAVDVVQPRTSGDERYTFPAPVLIGQYYDDEPHLARSRLRIDYMLTSPKLAKQVRNARILHDERTDGLSDHYPVSVEFDWR